MLYQAIGPEAAEDLVDDTARILSISGSGRTARRQELLDIGTEG
jgi:hypothetical protein